MPPSGGRATVVVEPPALPLPGSERDPRQAAVEAAVDELERLGIPTGYQTLLVAGGLARRAGHDLLEGLVSPTFARRFHGHVEVHDVESDDLVELGHSGSMPLRVHPALVRHRRRRRRHRRGDRSPRRAGRAPRRVGAGGAAGGRRVFAPGDLRVAGLAAGRGARAGAGGPRAGDRRVARPQPSAPRPDVRRLPVRRGGPRSRRALAVSAPVLAAPGRRPGIRAPLAAAGAHGRRRVSPARRRSRTRRRSCAGSSCEGRRSTGRSTPSCIGVPRTTPYLPRERPNPLLGATLGLGLALRLWRDAFPVADGGTAILLHRFQRQFAHPTQQPYRAFFNAARGARIPPRSRRPKQ